MGWDELQWQDGSLFFYENGLGADAIKVSFGLPGSFNNAGWSYILGIMHNTFGLSYYNVIWVKMAFFFFAANSLYHLLVETGHGKKMAIIAVLFLAFYHPLSALDATYMRDDIIVYLIILLLRLSMAKGLIKGFFAALLFLFFSYILICSRPFAYLVFISLYVFYFRLVRPVHLLFLIPPVLGIGLLGFDILSYGMLFLGKFQFAPMTLVFLSIKYYIGPLPWQMIGIESGYSPFWYAFTLTIVLASFTQIVFYKEIFRNWKVLVALFISGLLPYVISQQEVDAVGPRQFAMVGPFLFIILYSGIVRKIKLS